MASQKTTFVLVHGAWHEPAHFEPLIQSLNDHGYKAVAPALPSVARSHIEAAKDYLSDVETVRSAVLAELDAGSNVVVVPHSYGGIPTTSALKDLDPESRSKAGCNTSVVGIASITSFVLPEGMNIRDAENREQGDISKLPKVLAPMSTDYFYNDMTPDQVEKYAALLKPIAAKALLERSKYSAHEVIPVHILMASEDKAMPWTTQERIVEMLKPKALLMRTEVIPGASHSPFISRVKETTDFLRRSAGESI
ncbi:uncharacterized protein Z518_07541 [Rhinocladiella mackenziei CBS 650.93]|uniref:Rhinocladiella mackenziei CBS 650.93 unplaced genomic scaffold supercont1.5, whole genome shotgun sequence n=1 Tax=Rhinocladiella mackenziei CBS 650.93 TaxID=1442369 RepID=A0A0D2H0P8_9EURO|nr:uncharacterized protein Z518_07541 [Rhinocladiella mackenziei CBS 650.93]KIX03988.1 hypothetical protein Z518_07541 [Rhinocladiella mackenziei CBS 650.93]